MTQPLVRLNPPSLPDAGKIGYSQITVMEPARMAYVSGQVAWRPGGEPVPDSLVEQMEIVAINAKAALAAVAPGCFSAMDTRRPLARRRMIL